MHNQLSKSNVRFASTVNVLVYVALNAAQISIISALVTLSLQKQKSLEYVHILTFSISIYLKSYSTAICTHKDEEKKYRESFAMPAKNFRVRDIRFFFFFPKSCII